MKPLVTLTFELGTPLGRRPVRCGLALAGMMHLGAARSGRNRVIRGGSWLNDGRNLRSAYRNWNEPDERNDNLGLRLAGALPLSNAIVNDEFVSDEGVRGATNQRSVQFRVGACTNVRTGSDEAKARGALVGNRPNACRGPSFVLYSNMAIQAGI